ncbi:MAG: glycosyltransferase family 2 protein [Spirochaetia bacterium]
MIVSAIIPVYNRPGLLREAYNSCIGQNREDLEVIIVDDGSEPPVKAEASDRTQVIRVSHTGRPGLLRNIGVKAARGRYIAFLDSDDLWLPGKIEAQLNFFRENTAIRICHTREKWIRSGKTVSQRGQNHRRHGNIFPDSLVKCVIGPSTVMMDRALYRETGGFREDISVAEDYEYWLRITCREDIGYIDEPFTVKRAGDWEQLSESGPIEYYRITALEKLLDSGDLSEPCRELTVREFARKCLIYAHGCFKRGKTEEGRAYLTLSEKYPR